VRVALLTGRPLQHVARGDSTLEAALNGAWARERIEGYTCEACRKRTSATRVARAAAHPPVLLLQLQRTRHHPRTLRPYKDHRPVPFPAALPTSAVPLASGAAPAAAATSRAAPADKRTYRLAAAIVHASASDRRTGRSSAEQGHYYALCREGEGRADGSSAEHQGGHQGGAAWLEKNDARVRVVSEAEVLAHQRGVFVLAYELVGC
jgi:hypothetical protein